MSFIGAAEALLSERIGAGAFASACSIELEPHQAERYLGPLEHIADAVRRGPAHAPFLLRVEGQAVGFFVLHPDVRDLSCWWLGWLALDRRQQGRGLGRLAMAEVVRQVRRVPGCRRVRLLVAPDNAAALRLYRAAGFRRVGTVGFEWMMEASLALARRPAKVVSSRRVVRAGAASRQGRLRERVGPHEARMIGVERGPPR